MFYIECRHSGTRGCHNILQVGNMNTTLLMQAKIVTNASARSKLCWRRNWRDVGSNLMRKGVQPIYTIDRDIGICTDVGKKNVSVKNVSALSHHAGYLFYTDVDSHSMTTNSSGSGAKQLRIHFFFFYGEWWGGIKAQYACLEQTL